MDSQACSTSYTLPSNKTRGCPPSRTAASPLSRLRGGALKDVVEYLTPTIHRDTITSPVLNSIAEPFRRSLDRYPFAIPERFIPFLQQAGIEVSGFGSKTHPHPVHKTIETHLLHDKWSHLATTPSTVMFMKPAKFAKLQAGNQNFTELRNYRLTPADTVRYPETHSSLPDTEAAFMHDALMYFTPAQILDLFSQSPKLEKLYASLVVPPESSFTSISLHPELYKFRHEGKDLVYELENNPSHAYRQPRSAIQWLQTSIISGPDFSLTVTRLESWGPVHSLLIQRGLAPLTPEDDALSFSVPDAIALPEPASLQQDLRHRLVPRAVYDALFIYVRAVRTLRVTDPAGFVRTQMNKPAYSWVTASAWDNLRHFCLLTAPHQPRTTYILFNSSLSKLRHWCRTHSLLLSGCGAALAAVILGASSFWVIKALLCRTRSFAVLHHWIVRPPHWLLVPKAPKFELTFFPRFTTPKIFSLQLAPRTCLKLAQRLPGFAEMLPRRRLFVHQVRACLIAAAAPLCSYALRIFVGPDSPQSMHDSYHRYFHPEPFVLTLKRRRITVATTEPFLPLPSVPGLEVPITDETPAQVSLAVPDSVPRAETQAEPLGPEPHDPAALAPPLTPAEPLSKAAEPTPLESEAPLASVVPAEHQPAAQPHASVGPPPSADLAIEHAMLTGVPPVDIEEKTGFVHTSEPATQETQTPHPSALMADGTCSGPPTLFRELYKAQWIGSTGAFLTRNRTCPPSDLPYPEGMDCLLVAISEATTIPTDALWRTLCATLPDSLLSTSEIRRHGLDTDHFAVLALMYSLRAKFVSEGNSFELGLEDATTSFQIEHTPPSGERPGHFKLSGGFTAKRAPSRKGSDLVQHLLRFRTKSGDCLPFLQAHDYLTQTNRAKNLISNMKNGFDGILANIDPHHTNEARDRLLSLDGIMDIAKPKPIKVIHIAGFAGCGKSYPIAQVLRTNPCRDYKIAVPTTELRSEWCEMLDLGHSSKWRVGTWESSLLKTARILVIDEIYKMPRGYLDLAVHADANVELVVLLGDPLQGEYHSTHPHSSNSRLSSEILHLSRFIDVYCWWSHRIPQNIAKLFQVPSTSSCAGFAKYHRSLPLGYKILANSQDAMRTLQQCGYQAITIASSQGSTYSTPANIHLDRNSALLSHNHSLVALTRSKVGVFFTGDASMLSGRGHANFIFSKLMMDQPVSLRGLMPTQFPKAPCITEPFKNRKTKLSGGSFYDQALPLRKPGDPTVGPSTRSDIIIDAPIVLGDGLENSGRVSCHFLPETRRPLHYDLASGLFSNPSPAPTPITPCPIEPVYPGETFENLAAHFLPAHDPQEKERIYRDTLSNQFPHLDKDFRLSCQPFSLVAPVHDSKHDPTLLPASISKRLRFRPSEQPYRITPKDEILGSILFSAFCRAMGRNPNVTCPFDEVAFAECINLNEFAQLTSKTQAVIMSNADRSNPDWRLSAVKIFSKTQHKVNEGSIFGDWKACQTLALMHDAVVLLLGPVKKYQRLVDARDRPPHIYVHAGNTPSQLSEFCQTHLTPSRKLANDYTAFDQSQHGEAVVFERLKMEYCGIPQHLIDLHVHLKTHVSTQFGPLTCMRLTGEPGTYDDNTDYNLAVINCEYAMGSTPVLVSGDDSLIDREPPTLESWPGVRDLLALRFKKERTDYPTFCGYYCGPAGALRSPIALFAKLAIAVDDGSISDKLASYLTEFAVGHSLGDDLWNLLPVEAVPFQSACFDFFCRHAPPELKLSLKIGEVPSEVLARLSGAITWASSATYALLTSAQRRQILHSGRQTRSLPDDPETTQLQGELLQNVSNDTTFSPRSDVRMIHTKLTGALNPASLSFNEAPTPMSTITNVGPPPSSDERIDRQPRLPPAPLVAETSAPSIDYPFQWEIGTYAGDKAAFVTDDISTSKTLSKITSGFRHAELLSLEVEFVPTSAAFSKPISTSVVWTIASINPATEKETSYFGGRFLTLGGPVLMSSTTKIPADLTRINPTIKSSVLYYDNPRLTYTVYPAGGTTNTALLRAIVRGVVRLSGPSGNMIPA